MSKQIRVSDTLWDDLDALKKDRGHTSFDSLIRELYYTSEVTDAPG